MDRHRRDSELVEHLLVLRAQLGESDAFTGLFERYNSRLLYYLRRLVDPAAIAEDILQEVWLTVVKKITSLDQPEAFKAWIYRIAHNRAMTRLRRSQRVVPLDELPVELEIDPQSLEENNVFLAEFDAAAVHRGLGRLSPPHREVLTLRYVGELSYEEIAEIVGCGLGTIRSRIYYAKKSLHDHLTSESWSPKPA